MKTVVRGIGHALPEQVVTNKDLETRVETTDEWIVQRTGIRERRVSSPQESTGSLSILAARQALENSATQPGEIDMVICATISPDYPWPATACQVQEALGIGSAGAFDVSAACAGFIYALATVDGLIQSGLVKKALVIGADCLTKQLDWSDRSSCVLFGDAAAAVVVEGVVGSDRGLVDTVLRSDGSGLCSLLIEAGGSKYPVGAEHSEGKRSTLFMAGKEVYRFAVQAMGDACSKVLEKAEIDVSEVDLFVPHQANLRIIQSSAERLGLPEEKVFINVDRYGNTSGGSIPLGLYEAQAQGRLKPGMLVMTVGFGAGLVWGANLLRW
jgi:3-oxoacyl-[acyl-carrier-protein] synthase-3